MTFAAIDLFFPVVLAIHNLDEYSRLGDFVRTYPPWLSRIVATPNVIRDAAVFLTLMVAVLSLATYVSANPVLNAASKAAIFALMLNGIGHCVLSLRQRSLSPGTLSAMTLVLPFSGLAIAAMRIISVDSYQSLLFYACLGALFVPVAILVSLGAGYGLSLFLGKNP